MSKIITIYTDGACSGNPGPGGWAFILKDGSTETRKAGGNRSTTNNRMELQAVIEAFHHLLRNKAAPDAEAAVFTDSEYVKKGITDWILRWEKNGWKTAGKKPVKNKELWMELRALSLKFAIKWHWIKGHAENPFNNACDEMARREIGKYR
ncbi:MAG: ribonuclease HI [Spirochaetales bacterium]|nr:ribonuclease HI [Spirochaetales bacterium]